MKTCGLIINRKKKDAYKLCANAAKRLRRRGIACYIEKDVAETIGGEIAPYAEAAASRGDLFTSCDCIIVFGGDGTMLDVAASACENGVPVLGVNLGQVGYLTDTEPQHMADALDKLMDGAYKIENRMTLAAVCGDKEPFCALNEICVSKGASPHMLIFDILLNGAYINTYRADGVIISTPTGSTAYNLSAGGPVLKPDGYMIAITPICPHGLFALPCVVSGSDIITVRLPEHGGLATFVADGRYEGTIAAGAQMEIRAGGKPLRIIKTNEQSFFDVLRQKMGSHL